MSRILVVGQGGREHAIVRQCLLGRDSPDVYVWPGSSGMLVPFLGPSAVRPSANAAARGLTVADTEPVEASSVDQLPAVRSAAQSAALVKAVQENQIDLVIIGPEQPLADGLSDRLRKSGVRVFGPSQAGARLESSKVYAKEFMRKAGVKTARSFVVETVAGTLVAAKEFQPPYVLKADGLAAGKGVFIETDQTGLRRAAELLFEKRIFGAAGQTALLEEFTPGYEVSHLVLTNGRDFAALPPARDHKRLGDGDRGPNTGGMGVVAPVALPSGLSDRIDREIVRPVIDEIHRQGILFRGVLYFGLMITPDGTGGLGGPSVLEFNTRFGDPEAQALLPLLDDVTGPTWTEVFSAIADGHMPNLKWKPGRHVACVVLAAEGYPDNPVRGAPIERLREFQPTAHCYALHAGTALSNPSARTEQALPEFRCAGGRVLNAVGISETSLTEALARAYDVVDQVKWPTCQVRRDIGLSQCTTS